MARPTDTTPIEIVVAVLRSLVAWASTHTDELATIFGQGHKTDKRAEAFADDLEAQQETFVREQREDVGLTDRRREFVLATRKLVTSGTALATIAFGDKANLEKVLRDFSAGPPSHIRSLQNARRALTRLKAAVDIHGDVMADRLANAGDFKRQVVEALEVLDKLDAADAAETAETNAALRRREETRDEALGFIRDMQLAAEAVEFMQPDALEDLHAVFDTHMPRRRPTVHEEELLEDLTDDPQSPEDDADAPTPTGEARDADADDDTVLREPTET